MIRILILALIFYVVITIFRSIVRALTSHYKKSTQVPEQDNPHKKQVTYRDVKDAKFVELDKKDVDNDQEKQD
jgi:hypothetical protein